MSGSFICRTVPRTSGRASSRRLRSVCISTSAFQFRLPALNLGGAKPKRNPALDDLLDLISETDRGNKTSKSQRAEIERIVDEITFDEEVVTTTPQLLSAPWRLLWTSEKETLFIAKYAGLFGTEAGDILQIIDVKGGNLQNVIEFPPSGSFVVESGLEISGPQTCDFRFTKAFLNLPDKKIELPPTGKGWFKNVYVDKTIRIARDSRGDLLITERAA